MLTITNHPSGDTVFIPELLVNGTSSERNGILEVRQSDNSFPPQCFEVNGGVFKTLVHLNPGENHLQFTQSSGKFVNGYPVFDQTSKYKPVSLSYVLNFQTVGENPVIHLCLLRAKNSPGTFDVPQYRPANDIDTAVRKMKFGARLMEAFTLEQMRRHGFGNRSFRFEEEVDYDTLSYRENFQVKRPSVKVTVLTVDKTVAEIQDPDVAQQNPKGKNTGKLFDWASDTVKQHGSFGEAHPTVACIYLDAHWDAKDKLLVGHAALGGGGDDLRLAIFGSQGLWTWPTCYEELYYAFSDCTPTDTSRVVNDCNECGTAWEALNVSLGAFLHEIGHALGCPHQSSGVMLRSYTVLNRTFMTVEYPCTRTGTKGYSPVLEKDECDWHDLDIFRFLYHPSFRLPIDYQDDTIDKAAWDHGTAPLIYSVGQGNILAESDTGIYLVELIVGEFGKSWLVYAPKLSSNGLSPQKKIVFNYNQLLSTIPPDQRQQKLELQILALGMKESTYPRELWDKTETQVFGSWNGVDIPYVHLQGCNRVVIYYGAYIDGIRFFYPGNRLILFGQTCDNQDLLDLTNDPIAKINLKSGLWIDALQIESFSGRKTKWCGNPSGGGSRVLKAPDGFQLTGLSGKRNAWLYGLKGTYGPRN